jgi:hypothetical protein
MNQMRYARGARTPLPSIFLTLAACAAEVPPPDVEVQASALFGSVEYGDTCTDSLKDFQEDILFYGRITARSQAFAQCLDTAVRTGVRGTPLEVPYDIGPYMPCTGDSFTTSSKAVQVEKALAASRSPNRLRINCSGAKDAVARSGANYGNGHDQVEGFSWSNWLIDREADRFTGGGHQLPWPTRRAVDVTWHEVMHTHDYHHGTEGNETSSCGYDSSSGFDYQRNTMPYIVGYCMGYTIDRAQAVCSGGIDSCPTGQLKLPNGHTSNSCTCQSLGSHIFRFDDEDRGQYTATPETVLDSYEPVVGDFDGNGMDDILWYGPGSAADYIWWYNADGTYTGNSITVGGSYKPLAGDFDGDGVSDVIWYAPGSAADYIWWFKRGDHSTRPYVGNSITVNGTFTPVVGDFDGDRTSDVIWYAPGSGADYTWWFKRGDRSTRPYVGNTITVNGTYTPVAGDFDGDGTSDVIWHLPGSGTDYIWWFTRSDRSTRPYTGSALTVNGRYAPVAGDFDGDGVDDVLWNDPSSEPGDYIWYFRRSDRSERPYTGTYVILYGYGSVMKPLPGNYDSNATTDIFWYRKP